MVKVWNLTNCKIKKNHYGHTGYLNTVTVSPDGSLCASGGKVRILTCVAIRILNADLITCRNQFNRTVKLCYGT